MFVPTAVGRKPVPLEVKLQPPATLALRVVDENGKPVPDAVVTLRLPVARDGNAFWDVTDFADGQGRFRLASLVPGVDYEVRVWAPRYSGMEPQRVQVEAGLTHDLGDLAIQTADQTVAGGVVDGAGKPVEGAQVHAGVPGRTIQRGVHLVFTDKEGLFRLRELVRGTVTVHAEANGKSVDFQTRAGEQNVRIVLR
jgi:hypothetical protein